MRSEKKFTVWKKTLAVILLLFGLIALSIGVIGTSLMIRKGIYILDAQAYMQQYLEENMAVWGKEILYTYYMEGREAADLIVEGCNIEYIVVDKEYAEQARPYIEDAEWYRIYTFDKMSGSRFNFNRIDKYAIIMMVPKVKVYPDYIASISFVAKYSSLIKWLLPIVSVAGLLLVINSIAYLFCGAGWSAKEQKQTDGALGFVPTDILLAFLVALIWGIKNLQTIGLLSWYRLLTVIIGIIIVIVGVLSLAARIKTGNIWKNSIVYKMGKVPARIAKESTRVATMLAQITKGIPLIWKTALITLGIAVIELIVLLVFFEKYIQLWWLKRNFFALWLLEKLFLAIALFYWMQSLCELKKAGKELAQGNSDYKVDTHNMFGQAKEHGEHLNSISEGVKKAVDERMKSEHLKTELITNVSHDIKTPLTSIINYSDLLCKEETENEKIREYAEVLHRQAGRLKKLVEDLMEASKASTGNIEVNPEPCDVGVLLTQVMGEFQQRMEEQDLELLIKKPQEPMMILADTRLLWRVMDNLITNICKYSQKGTRVYASVEEIGEQVCITLKNISKYALDIEPEELMERFIRGDRSRHTEGNGLGLNIAKSLTELQGGNLKLAVDGDLFKALLTFPKHMSTS